MEGERRLPFSYTDLIQVSVVTAVTRTHDTLSAIVIHTGNGKACVYIATPERDTLRSGDSGDYGDKILG